MATRKVRKFNDGGEVDGPDTETSPVYMASAKGEDLPALAEPVKAKPKMVTKEELAKSGLSLRDYMNKQQGLTRRGSSGSAGAKGPTAAEFNMAKAMPKRLLAPESVSARRNVTRINPDDLKGGMKGMGGASGFAKGGSVGSASRRADGCAMRGKTRA